MQITLTEDEMIVAASVGTRRRLNGMFNKRTHLAQYEGDAWSNDVEGAAGEMAVAKGLKMYWNCSATYPPPGRDVGNVEVRTRSQGHYELNIRPKDEDAAPFVLATGKAPRFDLRGWFFAGEAKQHPEWSHTHGGRSPAWFVPTHLLRSLEELIELDRLGLLV